KALETHHHIVVRVEHIVRSEIEAAGAVIPGAVATLVPVVFASSYINGPLRGIPHPLSRDAHDGVIVADVAFIALGVGHDTVWIFFPNDEPAPLDHHVVWNTRRINSE